MSHPFNQVNQVNQRAVRAETVRIALLSALSLVFFLALVTRALGAEPGRLALVQYNADVHFGDYDFNLKQLTRYAEDASRQGAGIVVFPEGSTYGYSSRTETWCSRGTRSCGGHDCRDVSLAAEAIPSGRTTQYWIAFARSHAMYVLFDLPEVDGARFYNSVAVVGPQGYITKYRKRSLYFIDECYATPGTQPVAFDSPYGRFGLLICADANSVSKFTGYLRQGANAVILPMDWDQDPGGANGGRPARTFFAEQARSSQIDIYASDVSPWDGTGKYPSSGAPRERRGLPPIAVGQDGFSLHELRY